MEVRRLVGIVATATLGAGAAFGVAACGDEEREGTVEIQGGATGTGATGTAGAGTAPTSPATTPTSPATTPTLEEPATVDEAPTTPTSP